VLNWCGENRKYVSVGRRFLNSKNNFILDFFSYDEIAKMNIDVQKKNQLSTVFFFCGVGWVVGGGSLPTSTSGAVPVFSTMEFFLAWEATGDSVIPLRDGLAAVLRCRFFFFERDNVGVVVGG
jgi:hypothetical protein